jgi:trk system potassium uptake protein
MDNKLVPESIGATDVNISEKEMANKIAKSLLSPNILDCMPLTEDYMICEIAPPAGIVGRTLREIHLRSKFHINIIAIRDTLTHKLDMVPADYVVKDSEILVVMGKTKDIDRIKRPILYQL